VTHVGDDLRDASGRLECLLEPRMARGIQMPPDELEVARDDGERVVDLVRGRVG
jgi:hypothetical protein